MNKGASAAGGKWLYFEGGRTRPCHSLWWLHLAQRLKGRVGIVTIDRVQRVIGVYFVDRIKGVVRVDAIDGIRGIAGIDTVDRI